MSGLNETPKADRIHIGVFGRTNSGKSSFVNAFTNQKVSIVSDVAGTTTDPVYKAMEIHPLGACVFIDTAGFDDESDLGTSRIDRTMDVVARTDIAVIVFSFEEGEHDLSLEKKWYAIFTEKKTPVLFVINKSDLYQDTEQYIRLVEDSFSNATVVVVSSANGAGIDDVKSAMVRLLPENKSDFSITGDLVNEDDMVLLVMPQDIQAPKGRLILPQVQTIRELLDKKCLVCSVTTDKLRSILPRLTQPPKLIITDSQVFDYVYENKPKESMLTSFSVLFAAYKGDLQYYIEGAKAIDALTEQSKVLIAECCTHAPLEEDIGRVKIPAMLRKRIGAGLRIDHVSGGDFPDDPGEYDLIIQCGACMFNRKYVLSRIDKAKSKCVPMTNYGVTIAHIKGILDKISY